MGIGFAIPTALVEQVMNAIIKDGKVSRGWLGIEVLSQLRDPSQIDNTTGVVVRNIIAGSPAAKSGLKVGDVILSIDGVEMTDSNRLIQHVARKMPHDTLKVQVLRNSKNMNIDITLAERPTQTEVVPPQMPMSNDDPELYLESPEGNANPLSDEQRAQLREELIELFENGARPKVDPLPHQ